MENLAHILNSPSGLRPEFSVIMDDYFEATIQLLLEKNRKYLSSIRKKYATNVQDDDQITAEYARVVIMSVSNINFNPSNKTRNSSICVCKKCGQKDVVSRERQIRSSDEGSTIVLKGRVERHHPLSPVDAGG